MEEVKVDLHLCESADQPVHAWGRMSNVRFQKNVAADQWENVETVEVVAPVTCTVKGMQMWFGNRLLCYFPLGTGHVAHTGETIAIEPGGIISHAGTATCAYLELAATLSAIDQSQEFETLRRQLMGAVEEGKLWLR